MVQHQIGYVLLDDIGVCVLPTINLSLYFLTTLRNENTITSITVLARLYYPNTIFHLGCDLQEIIEFGAIHVLDEES